MSGSAETSGRCGRCRHFDNAAAAIEAALPAMLSLSSAYGTSRGDGGFCALKDVYLGAAAGCVSFAAVPAGAGPTGETAVD